MKSWIGVAGVREGRGGVVRCRSGEGETIGCCC